MTTPSSDTVRDGTRLDTDVDIKHPSGVSSVYEAVSRTRRRVRGNGEDETYIDLYLGDRENTTNPYASPLLAPDLSGLPPALVMSAEYDSLAAEDAAYAQRLRDAGVAVEERCWEGQFHGSMQLAKLIPDEAAAYHDQVVTALRRAFGTA